MPRKALLSIAALVTLLVVILSGCSTAAAGGGGKSEISITASWGIFTTPSPGNYVLDAGYVATGTADSVVFTVTNTTSADFSASSSGFTNTDFMDSTEGPFDVPAGQSNTFTVTFTPTYNAGATETDALTLTPSSGDPIVIQVKGTSGAPSFLSVTDGNQNPITSASGTVWWGANSLGINSLTRTGIITLTGSPLVRLMNTVDFSVDTSGTSTTITAGNGTSFSLNSLSPNGATTVVTIGGQESTAGVFLFTFTLVGMGN